MRSTKSTISQPKKKFLRSKRLDVSQYDTPELHWSFYDAYHLSSQAVTAIAHGENSIDGVNLDKYLALTKTFTKIPTMEDLIDHLPAPFNELIFLQEDNGKFEKLAKVLQSLSLPKGLTISRAENAMQVATALAIAAMRQRIDLFEQLQFSHDMAVPWVHHGLILDARDLLADYTLSPEEMLVEYPVTTLRSDTDTVTSGAVVIDSIAEDSKSTFTSVQSPKLPNYQYEIQKCRDQIFSTEMAITGAMGQLEGTVDAIKLCLKRCIHQFLTTDQLSEKNAAFDELTCMVGDGVAPRDGFLDWRKDGVVGLRPTVTRVLNLLNELSDLRMQLEEYRTEAPSLSTMHLDDRKYFSNDNRGRWTFHYNGENVAHRVLHCLDFMRFGREISSWYGRKYWFLANPLQLPFNYNYGFSLLEMGVKVRSHLKAKPHQRASTAEGSSEAVEWSEHQFYNSWASNFASACNSCWQFNWPAVPDLKPANKAKEMHTALLVLYCSAAEEIEKTVREETEFMNMVKAGRGEHLMVGKTGMKPNRKVKLPSDEVILNGIETVLQATNGRRQVSPQGSRPRRPAPRRLAAL